MCGDYFSKGNRGDKILYVKRMDIVVFSSRDVKINVVVQKKQTKMLIIPTKAICFMRKRAMT